MCVNTNTAASDQRHRQTRRIRNAPRSMQQYFSCCWCLELFARHFLSNSHNWHFFTTRAGSSSFFLFFFCPFSCFCLHIPFWSAATATTEVNLSGTSHKTLALPAATEAGSAALIGSTLWLILGVRIPSRGHTRAGLVWLGCSCCSLLSWLKLFHLNGNGRFYASFHQHPSPTPPSPLQQPSLVATLCCSGA